ncbi:hypothetical protein BJY00DRAFT_282585 [Aspergillus carlsbadensis]|nr:hypothetical protein BJY00DRAFT_282585 [Aspergillus carlsbadensis]
MVAFNKPSCIIIIVSISNIRNGHNHYWGRHGVHPTLITFQKCPTSVGITDLAHSAKRTPTQYICSNKSVPEDFSPFLFFFTSEPPKPPVCNYINHHITDKVNPTASAPSSDQSTRTSASRAGSSAIVACSGRSRCRLSMSLDCGWRMVGLLLRVLSLRL